MTAATEVEPARCQGGGTRWDPKSECGYRPRWTTAGGTKLCGRHLRHAGKVTPWPAT